MTRRILIVGAGIGGLALAQGLNRTGEQVTVIEQQPKPQPAGAGLILSSNAVRIIDHLGFGDDIRAQGCPLAFMRLTDAQGQHLQEVETAPHPLAGPTLALQRTALHQVLLTGIQDGVRYGVTTKSIRERPDGVDVQFSDGRVESYDVVIGADGLHSHVRSLCFEHAAGRTACRYAGYTTWRMVIQGAYKATGATEMWGVGRRLGVVPLGHDLTYLYFTANMPAQVRSSLAPPETARWLQTHFAPFGGIAPELLARLESCPAIIRTDVHEVRLPQWVSQRVGLLGDAAHAMTPNLAQGAAMSLEDAYVLMRALISSHSVSDALRLYQRERRVRVCRLQRQARWLGWMGQHPSLVTSVIRNQALRLLPAFLQRRQTRAMTWGGPIPARLRSHDIVS